jgi:hypothetical protein
MLTAVLKDGVGGLASVPIFNGLRSDVTYCVTVRYDMSPEDKRREERSGR